MATSCPVQSRARRVGRRARRTEINTIDAEAELARILERIANLRTALESSETIAVAIGITMERLQVTRDAAFTVLREASQQRRRKLRDVAADVVFSGEVPVDADSPARVTAAARG